MYHSTRARGILAELKIGELDARAKAANNLLLNPYSSGAARPGAAKGSGPYGLGAYDPKKPLSRLSGASAAPTRPAIDEVAWRRYDLLSVTKLNHDTSIFRFNVPHKARLNVGMGRHLSIGLTLKGKMTKREYTPITDEAGYFELMIKKYDEGPMSSHLHGLKVGDGAMMRGLYGNLKVQPDSWHHLFMFAAGTGIAPMMTFIRYWAMVERKEAKDKESATENDSNSATEAPSKPSKRIPKITKSIHLIYANKTPEDVLLKEELEKCVALGSLGSFTIDYIISRPETPENGNTEIMQVEKSEEEPKNDAEEEKEEQEEEEPTKEEVPSCSTEQGPISNNVGRLSSSIMSQVFDRTKSAWKDESVSSGPVEKETFALVCGPDGFAATVKSLLETDWNFPSTSFHIF